MEEVALAARMNGTPRLELKHNGDHCEQALDLEVTLP